MKRGVTNSIVTPQNLIRSKQRKGKLKKSVKIRNKKPVKIKRFSRVFGRGDGIRTHDLMVPNHTRYQLRYASIFGLPTNYNKWFLKCQSFLCYE